VFRFVIWQKFFYVSRNFLDSCLARIALRAPRVRRDLVNIFASHENAMVPEVISNASLRVIILQELD